MTEDLAGVLDRLERLERENAELRHEVRALRDQPSERRDAGRLGRRDVLRLAGAAAVGGVGASLASAGPAAATNGQAVVLGETRTSTADTGIQSTATALYGSTSSSGSSAILGDAVASFGGGTGVRGKSAGPLGIGVHGETTASEGYGIGVWGRSFSSFGTGVLGEATPDSGVTYGVRGRATSPQGFGLYSDGNAKVDGNLGVIGRVNADTVRIRPGARPATGSPGELAVDKQHRLWFCRGGSDWVRLA